MSQLFSYFRKFLPHNNATGSDRKRRVELDSEEVAPQFPKYRRVSNNFPKHYNHGVDNNEPDFFNQVKRSRQNYNEILENFLMEQKNQQRKHFQAINDDEFSDGDDIDLLRAPNTSSHQSRPSGFNFESSQQSSFNFSRQRHQQNGDSSQNQFVSSRKPAQKPSRMPELVPIARSVQHLSNGYENTTHQPNRRSVMDFMKQNRAFNDTSSSSSATFKTSILDRNHNLDVKRKYDKLLQALIPRFAQKAINSNSSRKKAQEEPIPTVDLLDDTENNVGAGSNDYSDSFPRKSFEFKKPLAFVDLSDDEFGSPSFISRPVLSSTLIRENSQSEIKDKIAERRRSQVSVSVPEVKPVNSLKERQESRTCLKDDAIASIIQKFEKSKKQNETQINETRKNLQVLSSETAAQEKLQQKRIEDAVTKLNQCIILDEEDETVDEFPPLTEQQLHIVRYGLVGSRNEVIATKFNMNITRNDLNTLDGLNWLNDEVINYYMELIKERSQQIEYLPKVHVMNTFFIPKLLSQGHSGVKRWTRKIDVFSYDLIPVPVHVGGVHWCMSVIHLRDKTIRYYDSMGHPNYAVLDALEKYLKDESLDKKKVEFDTSDWKIECVRDCPQQRNGSDCGVFSCMFAEFISRDSKITFDQQHMQYFRRKMVVEIATGKMILG